MKKISSLITAAVLAAAVSFSAAGCGQDTGTEAGTGAENGTETGTGLTADSGYDASSDSARKITVIPGTDQVSAAQIPFGEKLTEDISGGNRDSWFSFTTGSRGTYTITAVAVNLDSEGNDALIRLCDTAGNELGRISAQHYGAPETITADDLDNDSTYYIDVSGRQGTEYALYLTSPDEDYDPAEDLVKASPEEATAIAAASTIDAELIPLNCRFNQNIGKSLNDWFAFQTDSDGTVYTISVSSISSTGNSTVSSAGNSTIAFAEGSTVSSAMDNSAGESKMTLHILDKFGSVLASSNTPGEDGSLTAVLADPDPDSVYYIAVSGEQNTGYTLLISDGG